MNDAKDNLSAQAASFTIVLDIGGAKDFEVVEADYYEQDEALIAFYAWCRRNDQRMNVRVAAFATSRIISITRNTWPKGVVRRTA